MADRRRQIELLIATRFDLLHFPAGALRTSPGLAPSERIQCPDCDQAEPGWRIERRGGVIRSRVPCVTCGGHVTKTGKPKPGKGLVAIDGMDSSRKPIGSSDTSASSTPRRRVKCDGCQDIEGNPTGVKGGRPKGSRCELCEGTGWRDLHVFDLRLDVRDEGAVDALDNAIDRRDKAGSYHELDVALASFSKHVNKPLRFAVVTANADQCRRLLDELYLRRERELQQMSLFEQALVELAMDYLEWRMPNPIRVPGDVIANRRIMADHRTRAKGKGAAPLKVRDSEIRKLARAGKPVRWIAAEYGVSLSLVYEIVNGREQVA